MCDDFMDDYDDDFEGEDFGDECWDDPEDEIYDLDQDDLTDTDEPVENEPDKFTWKDAVILGGAMGWAYEEGFIDGKLAKSKEKK